MITIALLLVALPQSPPALHFERKTLSTRFLCEGAAYGDLDGDGDMDVVAGPWWYEGPAFETRHAIQPEKQFPRLQYSDNFFAWVHDLDRDGRNDVFFVGFPGKEAWWIRNTGEPETWEKHVVFDSVDNESPHFVDMTGDGRPELVCQNEDRLGWAEADWSDPRKPWMFHAVLPGAGQRFTHGLGVGDVNGDGRPDLLRKEGWYEHPAKPDGEWVAHPQVFSTSHGGAQMLVTDVDGDGDADVVTSNAAHNWGLSWFEQQKDDAFVEHEVLAKQKSPGNVSELHALTLADLDGDGLLDVVTGKRWWSHGPTHDGNLDGANDPAVLLGLLLRRDGGTARYEPLVLDTESGVGTQVEAGDLNADGRCDVVVANKRGTFVLLQQEPSAQAIEPDLTFESGTLRGWTTTGDAFLEQPVRGDTVKARRKDMTSGHEGEWWIGGYELAGDGPVGTLTSEPFLVTQPYASFLVGGGDSNETRVEVLDAANGEVIAAESGASQEEMQRVLIDLTTRIGKSIRVRIVDEASGGWGHVNFDEFRFHAEPIRGLVAEPVAGKTPLEAAAAMKTPDGFHVDLIAGEPDLHQPVALSIDHRGRLWVAEAYSYPKRRDDAEARDAIVVFEDQDHDGAYEKRTVFYDKLNLVSGFATGFGGVWVGAAPYLLFIADANDDLVPDAAPRIVLDGFGYEDTHETLNSFTWGPDGWLYGTHGVFTHSKVGKPGTPQEQRVPLNCAVWRFQPQREVFEVFAWGTSNPWGVDFDDRGEAFITACVIPHLWHMVQGGRYQRQGGRHFDPHPYFEIGTIADHLHYEGDIGAHAWWGRNRPVADPSTDVAGGGHAHCGTLVYLSDAFGAGYRNAILTHNIHGNRVNQDRVERSGSGYVGHHAPDLVRAEDPWFRGVALRQGPAGEIFFIDWYDKAACHRTRIELWDRTNGRLYRLRAGDVKSQALALHGASDEALVALQADRNEFMVRHARRLLQERGRISAKAETALREMLASQQDVTVRLRALWTMHAVGLLADGDARTQRLLSDAHEDIRAWTIRLTMEQPERFPAVRKALPFIARDDRSVVVRLACASALQRLPIDERWAVATPLLAHGEDADDHNLPAVLWYGIEPLADADTAHFLHLAQEAGFEPVRRAMARRLGAGSDDQRNALCAAIAAPRSRTAELLAAFGTAVRENPGKDVPSGWAAIAPALLGSNDPAVREPAAELALAFGDVNLAPLFRARLLDKTASDARRIEAIDGLVRLRDAATGPLLLGALSEPALRRAALAGLAAYELDAAPARILAVLGELDPTDREVALGTLCSRPRYARAFLSAVVDGLASPRLLDAASLRRQLLALGDPSLEALLQKAWGRAVPKSAAAEQDIARYRALLTPEFLAAADKPRGRAIFARTCQACHSLFGRGGTLAPDLTGANRGDLEYLLGNVVDPSAEMGKEYQLVTLRLADGRMLGGNLVKETAQTLTLRTVAGDQILRRKDLAADAPGAPAIDYAKISLMPPGQLQALSEQEARDLIGYLMSPRQTPIAASPENAGAFFNGRDLSGWEADPKVWSVEGGELVGRTTTGLPHNDWARSELVLGDFRLVVDVKLSPDEANSGIQFRSEGTDDGEVAGYQADIGKGWWGHLYEEHGRAILQKAESQPARPGEWNTYEIVAVGDRVQLAINGVRTVDLVDAPGRKRGIVAPQVHSGGPTEVRFRNFRLELDPQPVLSTVR
ncbi:MAG: DUF1080 domain-containing protein [Planctomycetes bacterium]|nr:DUF1080 domain-containing protein [Planctomycetota bacterium]